MLDMSLVVCLVICMCFFICPLVKRIQVNNLVNDTNKMHRFEFILKLKKINMNAFLNLRKNDIR